MSPCSNCLRSERSCVVAPRHRRCKEERLEAEEEAAAAQEQEAYARCIHLCKQQKALKTHGTEMLQRGLKSLNELEAAKERERIAFAETARLPMSPPTINSRVLNLELDFSTFDYAALSLSY
ncbi:hypothetical protein V500_04197 [Pseudogymnoascus sp. VKM F-4518 (FW-2643)]|nr:hypothetical protein V500_04197 [Pseudogymnoascus sp. VKM F-4518 (FW-2643)]